MAANPELNPIDQEITNSINLQVLGAVGGGGTSIPIQYPNCMGADYNIVYPSGDVARVV